MYTEFINLEDELNDLTPIECLPFVSIKKIKKQEKKRLLSFYKRNSYPSSLLANDVKYEITNHMSFSEFTSSVYHYFDKEIVQNIFDNSYETTINNFSATLKRAVLTLQIQNLDINEKAIQGIIDKLNLEKSIFYDLFLNSNRYSQLMHKNHFFSNLYKYQDISRGKKRNSQYFLNLSNGLMKGYMLEYIAENINLNYEKDYNHDENFMQTIQLLFDNKKHAKYLPQILVANELHMDKEQTKRYITHMHEKMRESTFLDLYETIFNLDYKVFDNLLIG